MGEVNHTVDLISLLSNTTPGSKDESVIGREVITPVTQMILFKSNERQRDIH